jgi:hypothetical protein
MGGIRRIGALALTVVLGVGLTACGGGSDDESSDASTTTSEPSTDGTSADDGDGASGVLGGDCEDLANAFSQAGEASSSAFSGEAGGLEEAATYFQEVADEVPDEIADDFKIFADAYADFAKALADADIDLSDPSNADPEAMAELQTIMESLGSDEVQEASNNIQAYVSANCEG